MQQRGNGPRKPSPSGVGGGGGGEEKQGGVHVCSRCRWPFVNAHPSSKKRAAHRKHCGKIEGYAVLAAVDSDAESSLADSVHGNSVRMEELVQGREMSSGNYGGGKDKEELIKSDSLEEAENPSNLGVSKDGNQFDNILQLQDTALLISENSNHAEGSPFMSEDKETACSRVTDRVPDDCASIMNVEKQDTKPCPEHEVKSESGKEPRAPQGHELVDRALSTSFGAEISNKLDNHSEISELESIRVEKNSVELGESDSILPSSLASQEKESRINESGKEPRAPQGHELVDRALSTSFGAEISNKPDNHSEVSELESIRVEKNSVELGESDSILPSSLASQEKESRINGSSAYNAVNSDHGANTLSFEIKTEMNSQHKNPQFADADALIDETKVESAKNDASFNGIETGPIDIDNIYGQEVKDNYSYTARSMPLSQDLGRNEMEKKQKFTDLSVASGMGRTANEGNALDDENTCYLQYGVVKEYQETTTGDSLQHSINVNPMHAKIFEMQPDAHENVGEIKLIKEVELIENTLSDNEVGQNGTYVTLNHLENVPEGNFGISKTNTEDIQKRSQSTVSNGTINSHSEVQTQNVKYEPEMCGSEHLSLNCDSKLSNSNGCVDSSTRSQPSTWDFNTSDKPNADVFREGVASNIHYQLSGDKLVTAEKEQPDTALVFLNALDETTSQTESTEAHCSSMNDGTYLSTTNSNQAHAANPMEDASGKSGPANGDPKDQLTSMAHEPGMQTTSNIQPSYTAEQSISSISQDGNKELESQGRKEVEEIKTRTVTWKNVNDGILAESKKLHTPLKKLLGDADHDGKKRTPTQDWKSPITKNGDTTRTVQKEWNSPARLPITKKVKGKNKGKQQWVPLMCCSTTAI